MKYGYSPRGMPARYMDGAPAIVRRSIIDMLKIEPAGPLDFDIVFRPDRTDSEITGLDFDKGGCQGCHFFLKPHEARAYREKNRRRRVAWSDLPKETQGAILAYLES
ncbi:hypothetical protein HDIA_0729 [Hartmannibacter diazotrophicus]|uniref:Uncharacterized protein n=1 Tax=Hartmannibacter diazotrophicus TaxID=1482074 RepID=A0A2C9D200_9HYPH|nr:hypothetical protein [Hartmannibacter diazotrophicus]SON54270.1 hypothetical protein HDIA_0729 [Hartmannibacter diazotrophicus]